MAPQLISNTVGCVPCPAYWTATFTFSVVLSIAYSTPPDTPSSSSCTNFMGIRTPLSPRYTTREEGSFVSFDSLITPLTMQWM
eukprot:528715-Hanusia_phi.AAC.1